VALYGTFLYGTAFYGGSLSGLPTSPDFDIFDFNYPTENVMATFLSYPEVVPARTGYPYGWFSADYDYCMISNDGIDSGFRIVVPINSDDFTLEFSILPSILPNDFSNLENSRIFVGAFNRFGKMIGVLLSEMEGIALATNGEGPYSILADSADIFNEGIDYYVFRITSSASTGIGNIYVTRRSVLDAGGEQILRYSFTLADCPNSEVDNVRMEIIGSAGDTTQICLDDIALSSSELVPNKRPIAIISSDKSQIAGDYASFDGRSSYDPEGEPITFKWSLINAPLSSLFWVTGSGTTASDLTDKTNRVIGSPAEIERLSIGDEAIVDNIHSTILFVADDFSYFVTVQDIFDSGVTIDWKVLKQIQWGGSYTSSSIIFVAGRSTTPPLSPSDGDTYLIVPVGSGIWAGREGDLATWDAGSSSWNYSSPTSGSIIYVDNEFETYRTIGDGIWYPDEPTFAEISHNDGRTGSIGSVLGDALGLYTIELIVNDGKINSTPIEALLSIQETSTVYGLTPDLNFIWDYLSDFWQIVSGKEVAETIWSALAQLASNELLKLWQHDYSKSLMDIQRTFQQRWLNYDPYYAEPNYVDLPAIIENSLNVSGYSLTPNVEAEKSDGTLFNTEYAYNIGILNTDITTDNYLVINGISHKIIRLEHRTTTIIYTETPITVGTSRSKYWMVRPTVTSTSSNFSDLLIREGDSAVFETYFSDGNLFSEFSAYIYGSYGNTLSFDDSQVSSYFVSDNYVTYFKGIIRRSKISVDPLVMRIPRLQEVIAINRVENAPSPLIGDFNFIIETITTVQGNEINSISFLNTWFTEVARGLHGYSDSSNHNYFYDDTVNFETLLGADADLRGHIIEFSDGRIFRLYAVIDSNQIELFDDALPFDLANINWKIRSLSEVPEHLWAEVTFLDNRPTVEANFGKLIGFTLDHLNSRTDNLDYLSAVQGLWYFIWNARTPYNIRVGSQIILGLPFSEVRGTITDIRSNFDSTRARILIMDEKNNAIVRSYFYPSVLSIETNPATGTAYTSGDIVEQFAPLCKGVEVVDYISDPDWWLPFVGAGDFFEPQKISNFAIIINSTVFNLTNISFLIEFIKKNKPKYVYPYFSVSKSESDLFNISDASVLGPAVPKDGDTYPSEWPAFGIPSGWFDSPHESPRSSPPIPPPNRKGDWGGLHVSDQSGYVADGWSGSWPSGAPGTHTPTKAEGSFKVDDTDESGHCIHKVDAQLEAENILLDGDTEDGLDIGDPGSPWVEISGPLVHVIGKSTVQYLSPTHSIYISSLANGYGIYQEFPEILPENSQMAVRVSVFVVSGSVEVRLVEQDSSINIKERKSVPLNTWQEVTLHTWNLKGSASKARIQIVTGPGGGEFYIDNVQAYSVLMPWDQWGFDRAYFGRTGGYTIGGSPDEYVEMGIYSLLS
jgi:hypothetical protein